MQDSREIRLTKHLTRLAVLRSDLPSVTRQILLTVLCHVSPAGEVCPPSVNLLADETGLSKRTVLKHLEIARTGGWLV